MKIWGTVWQLSSSQMRFTLAFFFDIFCLYFWSSGEVQECSRNIHPDLKKKKTNSMFLHSLSLRLEASVCQNGAAYLFRKAPPPRLFFRRPLARLSPSFCSQSYVVLEGKTGAEERVSVVFTPDAKCLLVACLNGFTSMSKASFPNSPPLCQ